MTFDGRTGLLLTWNDLGLVEKVSLNDTVLVNYSYLANGIKKGHKTTRPPQGFARPEDITGCLVPKRHGTTYRVFVISSSLRFLYASNAHHLPEHSYYLGKKNAVFMSRYAGKHIICGKIRTLWPKIVQFFVKVLTNRSYLQSCIQLCTNLV